ncbi:MAG: asparagine synthase (glutamine-hydrolyzing), partial [Bacteroidales bacterium]|nr:asparagine synthase (glutamine-hydrolyzing) [Bacteroidales bacterium]
MNRNEMCGIAGFINFDSRNIKDTGSILKMLEIQRHRGPDDSGIRLFSLRNGTSYEYSTAKPLAVTDDFEGVLGFNRLSILDLSHNGHQPMISSDDKVLLTLNGEIYNAFDFKNELEAWGYRFRSTTDTEVVLALYLRYGFEEMLSRLNGMFAIVIIDLYRREIFIARDRFGIKPMYYVKTDSTLAFASELKSLIHVDGFNFLLAEEQLDEYLIFRNNLNGTLLRGIESLAPGHYLSFTIKSGMVKRCFFDINNYTRKRDVPDGFGIYEEKLERWLIKSVKSQLMSDVKLGCQLSGGVDSSLVTLLANRGNTDNNFESVSIVFSDRRFSEENYIDRVSQQLGITAHKFLLDSDYYLSNIEKATWHLEAPLNHQNTIGIYYLSQMAKEYVTVLLSGEGADEVFGGYERFRELKYPFRADMLLHQIRMNFKSPSAMINYSDEAYRAVTATAFMIPDIAVMLKRDCNYVGAIGIRKDLYHSLSGAQFDKQVKYEMLSYLPDLLIRQDKMSMAHSIENRVPFLDNEVVENSFLIPEGYLLLRRSPEGFKTQK